MLYGNLLDFIILYSCVFFEYILWRLVHIRNDASSSVKKCSVVTEPVARPICSLRFRPPRHTACVTAREAALKSLGSPRGRLGPKPGAPKNHKTPPGTAKKKVIGAPLVRFFPPSILSLLGLQNRNPVGQKIEGAENHTSGLLV